eukprot:gene2986-3443_t
MAPIKTRKLAIMGFRSVGKSSLSIQFVEGQFVDSYDPTIENTFPTKIKHKGQEYQIELVDTDEYSMISQAYTVGVHGYVLVYSVTSQKSYEVVQDIREKLLDLTGSTLLPIILVGNKTDLHMERTISLEQGKSLADSWHAVFIESSAKENKSARDVFYAIINEIERLQDGGGLKDKENCLLL